MVQILVLAAVALFLFWRLKSVLGSRQGFEKTNLSTEDLNVKKQEKKNDSNIVELKADEVDEEIADYVELDSPAFVALSKMKKVEKGWLVSHFVSGAKMAYEEILMAFEKGDLATIKKMTSKEVCGSFKTVIDERANKGLSVEAEFGGVRDLRIKEVHFNDKNLEAKIKIIFKCELTYSIKDQDGKTLEGSSDKIKKQRDIWTFSRKMNSDLPNWYLIKTE
tara:strand:- start:348 stop:1010 length:663 start_codon:yes stop_codon:yes gene_type:complete